MAGFNFDLRQKCFRVVDAGNVDRRQRNQELLERKDLLDPLGSEETLVIMEILSVLNSWIA